ncbi:MAG TPA: hypothetical protein VF110_00950 [Burkholderiales bacterium]|jgi:hypothetical protein
MKIVIVALAVLVVGWLGLWVSNTGILVYSEGMAVMRDCRYFVGVSVVKRLLPLAERCPVIRTVGA